MAEINGEERHKPKFQGNLRWLLVFFTIFGAFTYDYTYDNPEVLKDMLEQHFKGKHSEEEFEIYYSLMYSIMALPNVLVPLIIGLLVDKLGVRVVLFAMSVFVCIGAFIIYGGINSLSFTVIYIGRLLVGAGGESLHIVEAIFLKQYFSITRMSFVVAIIQSWMHLGGIINAYTTPRFAADSLKSAFLASALLALFTMIFFGIACLVDKRVDQKIQGNPQLNPEIYFPQEEETERLNETEMNTSLEIEQDKEKNNNSHPKESFWQTIKNFPRGFWFIAFAGGIAFSSILSFMIIAPSYTIKKGYVSGNLKTETKSSGEIVSLFRISAAIFSPIFGYFIDKAGNRSLFLLTGCLTACVSHLLAIFIHPILTCLVFGISFAVISTAIWPTIFVIIQKAHHGFATGIINTIDNTGLLLFPVIDGVLENIFGSYDASQTFLFVISLIGAVCAYKIHAIVTGPPAEGEDRLKLSPASSLSDVETQTHDLIGENGIHTPDHQSSDSASGSQNGNHDQEIKSS